MRMRWALTDLPLIVLAVVLLIPLFVHIGGIVATFARELWTWGL